MISLASFFALLCLFGYIFMRLPAVAYAGFFLLFALAYRSVDILYLDLAGPLYASELGRYVGGNDAGPMFYYAAASFAVPLIWTFRPSSRAMRDLRAKPEWQAYHVRLKNLAFYGTAAATAVLYANLLRIGSIPLFEGIDRLEYSATAGIVHRGAYEMNFLLCFILGAFTVLPRLNGRDHDLRFAGVLVALIVYWMLTGNRFAVFYVQFSFYFMPFAAVAVGRELGLIAALPKTAVVNRLLSSRSVRFAGGLAVAFGLAGLVANSYYSVRNYRDPLEQIQERVFIQPVEMWAAQWDRVRFDQPRPILSREAFNQIVTNPIDPTRNTTIQYLMSQELGYFRSAELTRMGQQYNGGYPEVHFELFNPWIALITIPLFGLLTAYVLRYAIILLFRNMIMSSILCVYVFYGLSLHYAGGFVLFPLAPSYWLKVFALVLAIFWEKQFSIQAGAKASKKHRAEGQALAAAHATNRRRLNLHTSRHRN